MGFSFVLDSVNQPDRYYGGYGYGYGYGGGAFVDGLVMGAVLSDAGDWGDRGWDGGDGGGWDGGDGGGWGDG